VLNTAETAEMPTPSSALIGQILISAQRVSPEDIEKALAFQAQASSAAANAVNNRLGSILLRMGAISEENLLPYLAEQTAIPMLPASLTPSGADILDALSQAHLSRGWWIAKEAVPFISADGALHILARDPLDNELRESVRAAYPGKRAAYYWTRSHDLQRAQAFLKDGAGKRASTGDANYLRELAEEAPVIEFVSNVLAQAVDERASDIHIEPGERNFEVRYRVDGVLQSRIIRPRDGFDAIASRVKLISGLDIAERRLPQDGRVTTRVSGVELDVRVSSIPGVHGESLVLRLLPKERADLSLASLGMESDHLASLHALLQLPNGIILVTGPTGSGKSTTLYSALAAINDRSLKIVTVEDPVEYRMSGITQIQTHADIGYTFARALRSILRHDPDVIMIGEIRDAETAEIAIQSALTGHLVLATIHTNDAPSAFTRLLEMGIEPFLLATSVRGVLAQRLVRKLADQNVAEDIAPKWLQETFNELKAAYPHVLKDKPRLRKPADAASESTSYRGRNGIYELLTVTPELQEAIVRRAPANELADIGRSTGGFRTLREDGLIKAWKGLTSVEEVMRVAGSQSQGAGADDAMIAEESAR
jgi:general secretion pathway protein E